MKWYLSEYERDRGATLYNGLGETQVEFSFHSSFTLASFSFSFSFFFDNHHFLFFFFCQPTPFQCNNLAIICVENNLERKREKNNSKISSKIYLLQQRFFLSFFFSFFLYNINDILFGLQPCLA